MYLCQSLPACSPHPLSGLERERWGAGGRVQGEAGGRAARLELPDMGTRLTAGSNWLPSESLPLPLPDKVCCTQPLFLCSVQLTRNLGWDKSRVGFKKKINKKKMSAAQPRFMQNCIATTPAHTKLLTLWKGSFWLELGAWVKKQTRVKFWIFISAAREKTKKNRQKKTVKLAKCLKFKCRLLQCNGDMGRGSRWRYQRHKHRSNFTLSDFSPCKPTIEARDRGSERKFSYLAKLIQISNRSRDFSELWRVSHKSEAEEHCLQRK